MDFRHRSDIPRDAEARTAAESLRRFGELARPLLDMFLSVHHRHEVGEEVRQDETVELFGFVQRSPGSLPKLIPMLPESLGFLRVGKRKFAEVSGFSDVRFANEKAGRRRPSALVYR